MHLSVIVPAYNEEAGLEKNIKQYLSYLYKQNYDYELIIVNDGSTDNTSKIAEKLKSEKANVKFINNQSNQGKGKVVKQGLMSAQGDYRLFLDADGATSINHLDKVWPMFDHGYDLIIGSRNPRDAGGAKLIKAQSAWKRLFGVCGNRLIQALLVWGIWDTQCGFKVFSAFAVNDIVPRMTVKRWAFDAEMLTIASIRGLKIGKIPVAWKNAEVSRVGIKGYLISLKEVLKIAINKLSGRYKN